MTVDFAYHLERKNAQPRAAVPHEHDGRNGNSVAFCVLGNLRPTADSWVGLGELPPRTPKPGALGAPVESFVE